MLLSTPGIVLHTVPYSESSVVVKVFTRQLGMRSYIIKGVRGNRGRVKLNMLQPLSCLDMVVYDNHKSTLNHVKEISLRYSSPLTPHSSLLTENALRFFMTEVLYKALREEEPLPDLFDYVEYINSQLSTFNHQLSFLPITFLLNVARYLGISPLDNYSVSAPLFDLQEGRYISTVTESTLSPHLSEMLHCYMVDTSLQIPLFALSERRSLIDALLAYFQLHLNGFHNFTSHEILHAILK